MFLKNIKTALRYIKNHRQFALVNILGLTLGFFCFFLLQAYVLKERSFDLEQKQVYRLLEKNVDENGTTHETASVAAQIGPESEQLFDEIDDQTQILYIGRTNVGNDINSTIHQDVAVLETDFLNVFDFNILEGTKADLLTPKEGIILNESTKELFFGQEKALGKYLKTGYGEFIVIGVLEDFPENSHLENLLFFTHMTASKVFTQWNQLYSSDWSGHNFITYFKLKPGTNADNLQQKITSLAKEKNSEDPAYNSIFSLQPAQDIHLYSKNVEGEINKAKGNSLYVKLFFWTGLFILLVACFNYAGLLNISFMDRSKEIGLRQTAGASKFQLLFQFLSESFVLTIISMGLAYALLLASQPFIKNWFDTSIKLTALPIPGILLTFCIGLAVSILATVYPFWMIIQSNKTITIHQLTDKKSKLPFRRVMLVFQFVAVIAFLTASIVYSRQLQYLQDKELGFELDGLATVDINSGTMRSKFKVIKEEFLRIPEVSSVSVSSRVPGEWKQVPGVKVLKSGQEESQASDMLFICGDEDLLPTFQMNLFAGDNFNGSEADSTKVLLNQSAVSALGFNDPIGQMIEIPSANFGGEISALDKPLKVRVAGVVEDFQMEDFRTSIKPMVIGNWNNPIHNIDYYTLKIKTSDWQKTVADLKAVNDNFAPETPMEFNILGDKFNRFIEADLVRFNLLNFFSGIIVLLAFMGLFAMSAFVAKSRTKEIGIRKVLGSNVFGVVGLLSKDFVKLMGIGLLIASPITWYLIHQWLSDFAFRIDFSWWMIALSGIGCLILTLLTVSFQSIKAALVNPVKSLRTE